MQGTIRFFIGFLVMFGIAGAIDTATDNQLITLIAAAAVGLGVMHSGVRALNKARTF